MFATASRRLGAGSRPGSMSEKQPEPGAEGVSLIYLAASLLLAVIALGQMVYVHQPIQYATNLAWSAVWFWESREERMCVNGPLARLSGRALKGLVTGSIWLCLSTLVFR
jgi:Tfp pilus assembly protein PilV